jgi:hypothetical protein
VVEVDIKKVRDGKAPDPVLAAERHRIPAHQLDEGSC